MANKPLLTEELIAYLEDLFPDRCADINDNERTIFYKSGQRSVVNHLREELKKQTEYEETQ